MKKKIFLPLMSVLLTLTALFNLQACSSDDPQPMISLNIQLNGEGLTVAELQDLPVVLADNQAAKLTAQTDDKGVAHFTVPVGIYHVSVTAVKESDNGRLLINGNQNQLVVDATKVDAKTGVQLETLALTVQRERASILIKEIYNGGCQKNDGSGIFQMDKYITLYNNSDIPAKLNNLCIGMSDPYNAESSGHNYLSNGVLEYANEDWTPAINGIWYFQGTLTLEPYTEVVVNVHGAIDNTVTYANSVNFANANYYCMYDPESASPDGSKYNHTQYYPAPAEVIPTSHYLKAVKVGQGTGWPLSSKSPAIFVFQTDGMTPAEFGANASNLVYPSTKQGDPIFAALRIPRAWILDAVEVFNAQKLASCKKRLTPDLDNGYATLTSGQGHALIRRVDNRASETAKGTVYIDTNNSSNDFEETDKCSLRQ